LWIRKLGNELNIENPIIMERLSITYSLAEQCFDATRSIGLLNLSIGMLESLARHSDVGRLTLLSNDSFTQLDLPPGVEIHRHNEANGRGLRRMIWDQLGVYRAARRSGNDWLFMPKGFVSFLRRCPKKLAAYVPDTMHDYYERTYPGSFSRLECLYLKLSLKAAVRQAKVIFTCSEFTSSELAKLSERWGILPPPMHAIGTGFVPQTFFSGQKQNCLVVIVSPWRHKRTDLALDYLQRWQEDTGFKGNIDCVGSLPKGVSLPPTPPWRLHQRVPEIEYRQMIAQSMALINFSEYEGFGLPPVEAIIAGTCSVYSDVPASREVLSGMGAPFDNASYDNFAQALNRAMQIGPDQLQEWAKKLLERHNWIKGAEKIVQAMLKTDKEV
jgi:glycosyltransferase involved in cell wall biosynthesis